MTVTMSKEMTRNAFKFHHGKGEVLNGLGNNTWSPSNRQNTGVRWRRLLRGVKSVIQISWQTGLSERPHTVMASDSQSCQKGSANIAHSLPPTCPSLPPPTNTSARHPLLDTRRDTEPVNSTSPGDSPWKKKRPRMSVLSDCIRGR